MVNAVHAGVSVRDIPVGLEPVDTHFFTVTTDSKAFFLINLGDMRSRNTHTHHTRTTILSTPLFIFLLVPTGNIFVIPDS